MSRFTHWATISGMRRDGRTGVLADDDLRLAEKDHAGRDEFALGVGNHRAAARFIDRGHGRIGRSEVDSDRFVVRHKKGELVDRLRR